MAVAAAVEAHTVAAVIGNIYRYKSKGLRAQTLSPFPRFHSSYLKHKLTCHSDPELAEGEEPPHLFLLLHLSLVFLLLPLILPRSGPAFAVSLFFSSKTAQKSHVKPPNHLTRSNKRKSSWQVSSTQSAILKTVEKNESPGQKPGLTLLFAQI
jgi:hypothetical protein